MASRKWVIWSQDVRSGRWLAVNEGGERDMRAIAERMTLTAEKSGIDAKYVALPEGTEPLAIR